MELSLSDISCNSWFWTKNHSHTHNLCSRPKLPSRSM